MHFHKNGFAQRLVLPKKKSQPFIHELVQGAFDLFKNTKQRNIINA